MSRLLAEPLARLKASLPLARLKASRPVTRLAAAWAALPPPLPRRAAPWRAFLHEDGAVLVAPDGERVEPCEGHDDWPQRLAGENLVLVLSGRVMHQLVVEDVLLPAHDHEALLAWARRQFVHYHGPEAERWTLSAWPTGRGCGASAAHGIDLDELVARCERLHIRVRAAHPWWAIALRRVVRDRPAFAAAAQAELWLVEGTQVTRVVCHEGRLASLDQHWLAAADAGALQALRAQRTPEGVTPLLLGYGLDAGVAALAGFTLLATLDGTAPAPAWLGL